jgi:hypothetical protein
LLHLVLIRQGWNKSVTLRFILKEADSDECAAHVDNIITENMTRANAPPSPRLMRAQSASGQSSSGELRASPPGWGGSRRRFAFGRLSTQKSTGGPLVDSEGATRMEHSTAVAEGLLGDGEIWQCLTCTFRNIVPEAAVCEVCGADRGGGKPNERQGPGHLEQTADDDADQDDNCA